MDMIWTNPVSDDSTGRDVERAQAELSKAEFDLLIVCLAGRDNLYGMDALNGLSNRKSMTDTILDGLDS